MPTLTKTIAVDRPDGGYLEITAEERVDHPTLSDGFSVTGLRWDRRGRVPGRTRKRQGRDADSAGCIHEEILAACPQLAPVVALHLADLTGVPMHAKANGWYFYCGNAAAYEHQMIAAGKDYGYSRLLIHTNHDRAARALGITPDELPRGMTTRHQFDAFVDTLAQTYLERADHARAMLINLADDHDQDLESVA